VYTPYINKLFIPPILIFYKIILNLKLIVATAHWIYNNLWQDERCFT